MSKGRLKDLLEMVIEHCLGFGERPNSVVVITALLQIALIEATKATREVLSAPPGGGVGEMPLRVQEIDAQKRVQYFSATSSLVGSKQEWFIPGCRLKIGVKLCMVKYIVTQLKLLAQLVAPMVSQILAKGSRRRVKA